MAVRTVSDTGGNWNAPSAWVEGVVPIAGDILDFTATSGPLVVNVATAVLAGVDFTNYVNTITFNNIIQLNTNLNLGTGGYTQAGTSGLSITANTTISGTAVWTRGFFIAVNAAVTLTLSNNLNITDLSLNGNAASLSFILGGNTLSISNNISFIGSGTYTLNIPQDLQITNLLLGAGGNRTCNINGLFTISISGNLTENHGTGLVSGTTSIKLNGTGTWSNVNTGALRNNLTIDTTGTITVSGTMYYNTGILTYTNGTVATTGSTLNISGASTTLNCGNMNDIITNKWNNIIFGPLTYTLISDLNCQNFTGGGGSVTFTNSGGNIFISGNLLHNGGGGISGTADINLIGTGTWTDTAANSIRNNLNINTTGVITIVGNIYYTTGTLTYMSGTVITDGSTLNTNLSTTLDTNGIDWNNVFIGSGTIILTLLSNLNITGSFTLRSSTTLSFILSGGLLNTFGDLIIGGNANGLVVFNVPNDITINNLSTYYQVATNNYTLNGNTISIKGNLTIDMFSIYVVTGTTNLVMVGTGTWGRTNVNATGALQNNLTINTSGKITIGTNAYYNTGTLTYTAGKVITKNSTLALGTSTLINCHKINFDKIVASGTITMNEFFSGSPSLVTDISGAYTIAFQDNFEKIAKFVNIRNCSLSKPLQLLVITNSKRSSSNRGIRYINQSPNGIPEGKPSIQNQTTFGAGGLLADPNMK